MSPDQANTPSLVDVGRAAPSFTLKDQQGRTHRLRDYRGRWVVLYFYPRDNTPGCTTQACGFRDQMGPLRRHGAVVLGISPDDAQSHQKFDQKHGLGFPLLVDPGQKVATRYGVWREKNLYGRKHMGIVRTTYLINPDGRVAHRWDKVKVAGHIDEVLATLNELRKKSKAKK
ncbi:MAG: thioredoxin-dependent thiol peroxidase [Phycisphaeraceae bacterium]